MIPGGVEQKSRSRAEDPEEGSVHGREDGLVLQQYSRMARDHHHQRDATPQQEH